MILKDKASQEVKKLEQHELIEKYLNDIFDKCRHSLTLVKPHHDGTHLTEICKICGSTLKGEQK